MGRFFSEVSPFLGEVVKGRDCSQALMLTQAVGGMVRGGVCRSPGESCGPEVWSGQVNWHFVQIGLWGHMAWLIIYEAQKRQFAGDIWHCPR